ncbi:MAG: DUF362 domain-containing protein [Planctomycetota bacterium]|nr:DUF362 domain-containing protein [Planctomycetota bacterium]
MAEDVRDLNLPSVVAVVRNPDKLEAFDEMLEVGQFFETVEAVRRKSGKSKEDFLIALKPNFMMTIRIEDPPVVYTDPVLVERWIAKLAEAGYPRVCVVEAQNVYSLWYKNRSVNHVARVIGLKGHGYEVRDLTNEQFPFDYGGILGQHFVGETWRDADFRISFAKNKTHDVSRCTLVLKNTYGCLPAKNKFSEYHRKREVDECTIQALKHFPIHFGAIDATWSLDGPLGYKEGFDVLKDAEGNVICEGNIHHTETVIGGRDYLAVEHTGMTKMGLDPQKDTRFYKLAKDAFGERPFEVVGDLTRYDGWLNVGSGAADALDIGEEIPVMSHFLGESMAHVDTALFPSRSNTWVRKLMHRVGRWFFLKKVRNRGSVRVLDRQA